MLGALLFIIYINDITTVSLTSSSILLYTDDSMLSRPISTTNDYHLLQRDINKQCKWTDNNLLKCNVKSASTW